MKKLEMEGHAQSGHGGMQEVHSTWEGLEVANQIDSARPKNRLLHGA